MADGADVEKLMGEMGSIRSSLDAVEREVLELTYPGNLSKADPSKLAEVLGWIQEHTARLKLLSTVTTDALSKVVATNETVDSPTFGSFEKKVGQPSKKWKHDVLKAIIAERVIEKHTDADSGILNAPVARLIEEAMSYAGISYWRKKGLKEIGVNADAYCEKGEAKVSFRPVDMTPPEEREEEDDDFV